jgi:hypothetical protein
VDDTPELALPIDQWADDKVINVPNVHIVVDIKAEAFVTLAVRGNNEGLLVDCKTGKPR